MPVADLRITLILGEKEEMTEGRNMAGEVKQNWAPFGSSPVCSFILSRKMDEKCCMRFLWLGS